MGGWSKEEFPRGKDQEYGMGFSIWRGRVEVRKIFFWGNPVFDGLRR